MSETLSKRERLSRTVAGQTVDRLPVGLWRHFYVEETAANPLVERLLLWHRRFDFDLLKINVRAQYHSEAWGCRYVYSRHEHVRPHLAHAAVSQPGGFAALAPLSAHTWPLGEMLDVVGSLRRELGGDDVLLMTVFNPMSVAMDLAGGPEKLAEAIRRDPGAVHKGLRAVTDTFRDFVTACLERGADGIFFATTHTATALNFTREQYEEFGRPYDLEVLEAADRAFLNVLHVCKAKAYVKQLSDYPVQAIHWDTHEASNPSLADMGWATDGKALVGGLSQGPFTQPGGGETLAGQLAEAGRMMEGRPFIVSSTCTIPTESLDENVEAVCASVRGR